MDAGTVQRFPAAAATLGTNSRRQGGLSHRLDRTDDVCLERRSPPTLPGSIFRRGSRIQLRATPPPLINQNVAVRRRPALRWRVGLETADWCFPLTLPLADIAIIMAPIAAFLQFLLARLLLCPCGCICETRQRGLHEEAARLLIDMHQPSSPRQPELPLRPRSEEASRHR